MKRRRVVTTSEADEDARQIDEWWIQNRGAAPNLFLEELADALALLEMEAGVGVRQPNRAISGLRRYLLRSTRYHLYFVHGDDTVVVVGVWGATRRTTPRFADRVASTSAAFAAAGRTTTPGFVNRNGQEVMRVVDVPGTEYPQRVYELRCRSCEHRYGTRGSDNFDRKCPECQDGATGMPLA
jgi:plasmid stabilization system protein ParE